MAKLLTQAQFARKIRKSRGWISQLIKAGVIHLVDGKIDPEKAKAEIAGNIDCRMVSKPKVRSGKRSSSSSKLIEDNGQTLTMVRRDHELLKKQLTELEVEIKTGNLVRREEPVQWLISQIMMVKHAFMNFPHRMAPTLVLLSDEREIFLILREEIWKILREFAKPLNTEQKKQVLGGDWGDGESIYQKPDQGNFEIKSQSSQRCLGGILASSPNRQTEI